MVFVPYQTNIFGVQWDFFLDYSIAGLGIMPFLWGLLSGRLVKYNNPYSLAASILLVAGYLYWPIFNVFTFGAIFLAMCLAITMLTFSSLKK
jgi:hypothetical protein